MIPLLFILHVIGLGIILNRLPLRFVTIAGTFVYLLGFYLVAGHYFAKHVNLITPPTVLEDDYYRSKRPKRKMPFEAPFEAARPKGDSNPGDRRDRGDRGDRSDRSENLPGNDAIINGNESLSPPGMINNTRPRTDAEEGVMLDEYIRMRLKRQQIQTDSQPRTNP